MIRHPVNGGIPNSNRGSVTTPKPIDNIAISRWQPDVYVHSFVPQAFTAINLSPATIIRSNPVDSIDFQRYANVLYAQRFRTLSPNPHLPTWDSLRSSFQLKENLNSLNYGNYFKSHMILENLAQDLEIRSFNVFGAKLAILDVTKAMFSVKVPGLREDLISVKYGDTIILRQWVEQDRSLELGLYGWPAIGNSPGFTGYELNAVVFAVDKTNDMLHLRAFGLLNLPQIRCNIMFIKQARLLQSAQLAVCDIANELQKLPSTPSFKNGVHQSNGHKEVAYRGNWLQSMLFPTEKCGIIQDALPSAQFPQKWLDQSLNYQQKKAADAVMNANYGRLCYLINGPAGTGKTKTICEIVTQLGKAVNLQGCILLTAPSNQAADTLALRLKAHFQPTEMLRLNHFSRTFAEVPIDLMVYCCIEDNIFNLPPIDRLMRYKIVVTTCQDSDLLVQARLSNRDLFNLYRDTTTVLYPHQTPLSPSPPLHWSALIIDEAAQATEPDTLIPLSIVTPPTDAPADVKLPVFVLAGDQHQLGPQTYDKSTRLHISLFERLSNESVYAAHPLARNKMRDRTGKKRMIRHPFANFTRNYRSHSAILAVPSSLFYSNTLIPEASGLQTASRWHEWSHRKQGWPVHFMCNGGSDECEDVQTSTHGWYNKAEALKAVECAQDILNILKVPQQKDICIMSPFRAQVRYIRKIARERKLHSLNIGPVEAFQGLEEKIVIICTTRARQRFLEHDKSRGVGLIGEPKKFNVAVTRAKEGLVVIGNPWVLATDPCWSAFLKFCWRNDLYWKDPVSNNIIGKAQEGKVNSWKPENSNEIDNGVDSGGLEAALLYREKLQSKGPGARRVLGYDEEEQQWRSGVEAEEALEAFDDLMLDPESAEEEEEDKHFDKA